MRGGRPSLDRLLRPAASLSGAAASILILAATLLPAYRLEGVVDGAIALAWHTLRYYGEEARLSSLEASSIILLPVQAYAAAGLLLSLSLLHPRRPRWLPRLIWGASLASAVAAALILGLSRVALAEVEGLTLRLERHTSAGLASFGTSEAARLPGALLWNPIPLALPCAAWALLAGLLCELEEARGRASQPAASDST